MPPAAAEMAADETHTAALKRPHAVISGAASPNPATDPAVYEAYHRAFADEGLPQTGRGWLARAAAVSGILAADAAARDISNLSPRAEVSLLKSAGLLKVLGKKEWGGGGESWETAYAVIREVAKGDGSVGMLLGYHLLWSVTAHVVGTEEQGERWGRRIVEGNLFVGGESVMLSAEPVKSMSGLCRQALHAGIAKVL